jgi:hypothetical protein
MNQRIFQIRTENMLHAWLRDFLLGVRTANRTDATISFYQEKLRRFLISLFKKGLCFIFCSV